LKTGKDRIILADDKPAKLGVEKKGKPMRRLTLLFTITLLALPSAAKPEGFYVSSGVAGGAAIGDWALPLAGLEAAAGYGLDAGPGSLEFGAASGFVTSGDTTVVPLALTAAFVVPIGGIVTLSPGLRLGGALIGGVVEPFFGARLNLELFAPASPWGFYIGGGADLFLERKGILPVLLAGAGIKYKVKR
jgi:hypothetical protein